MKVYDHIFLPIFVLGFILFCAGTTFNEELNREKPFRHISTGGGVIDVPDGSKMDLREKRAASVDAWDFECHAHAPKTEGPKVQTSYGAMQGLITDMVYIFYGIPYADPPVGALRWKPPSTVTSWKGVYDATFPRAACMQSCVDPCATKVSEDCLYLNIFVPLNVNFSTPPSEPMPVMVWIHGGDFVAGSASNTLYDGRFISNFTHTVVVSVEYRLGAFGFLVSGKDPKTAAVGNFGILDQQAALLWVQQNIAVFGGDPNKVTIFGESAGAQSVSLHLMLQNSQPLFQQAVIQSLPFTMPLKSRHEALWLGKEFAKVANCSINDIACLLCLSPQAVLTAQMIAGSNMVNPFHLLEMFQTWGPFIDGVLIKEQPITAFQRGDWQKEKPLLLGTTSEEGVVFIYGVFNYHVSQVESVFYTTAIFKQHTLKILQKYMPLYKDTDLRVMMSQIVTDYMFLCPSRKSARDSAQMGSAVWMYVFDHVISDHRVWDGLAFCFEHVCHSAEVPFLFDSGPVANFTLSPAEELLAGSILCYWGTFAHGGDPTSPVAQSAFCQRQSPPPWPQYTDANNWLVMNLTLSSHAQTSSRDHICDFWDKLHIY
uniref:Carboxylic ester hydrolase n=1 Tax=Paramormyrops kingsleyae TaxID=1676925 RepID=A0A3B3Q665_9TELE|nr:crystal protein-like [Paramormyrops kingsleyae]XP_023692529.1 crystal protein-like [Paramormyrops kingsleyae]